MLAIRLPPDLEKRLTALAEKTGRTKTFYVREALSRYLEDLEDMYLAVERVQAPERRWSLEDLENELDLEG